MNKSRKSIIAILVLSLVITLMIPTTTTLAQTKKVTDAQLKKVMKCYTNILATNPYENQEGGFTAEAFLLKDLDKDGVPELIINGEAPQIFSYNLKNDEEMFIYNSWVYNTLYYSSKTKTILYTYEWKEKKDWYFYKVNSTQENEAFNVMQFLDESYSYTNGEYDEYDTCKAEKGYYKGSYYSENAEKTTKKVVDAAIKKLIPEKVKLETTIKNTEANRKKYLGSLKQFKKFASE